MEPSTPKDREWRRETDSGEYLVSSFIGNFDIDWINTAFDTKDMFWAKALPREQISMMLSQSFTLGLYKVSPAVRDAKRDDSPSSPRTPSPTLEDEPRENLRQVGIARFITDHITFAYLTDVFIDDGHRDLGLGKWLIKCCQEVMAAMPALRRGMLLTTPDVGSRFYTRELGFYDVNEEKEHMICMYVTTLPILFERLTHILTILSIYLQDSKSL